jgi:hypothetical protein
MAFDVDRFGWWLLKDMPTGAIVELPCEVDGRSYCSARDDTLNCRITR